MAVDPGGVVARSTDPAAGAGAWTTSEFSGSVDDNGGGLGAISCPTTKFCAAYDERGDVLTTDPATGPGATWTAHRVVGNQINGISCPSAHLCVATDDGGVVSSSDPTGWASAWALTSVTAGISSPGAISCPSAALCVAADDVVPGSGPAPGDSLITSTNPTGGAQAWRVDPFDFDVGLQSVSCPSASLCVAVGGNGNLVTTTRPAAAPTWQVGRVRGANLSGISCPSPTLCASTAGADDVLISTTPSQGAVSWHATPIRLVDDAPFRTPRPRRLRGRNAH